MVLLSPEILRDLALVLLLALGAALVTSRLRQPSVVGYLLAGAMAGPLLLASIANLEAVNFLADLGVTLLMFTIGLEFNFRKLRQVGFVALFAGVAKIGLLLVSVNAAGLLLGWRPLEALYLGAAMSVSSTVIVARLIESIPAVGPRERGPILGILIIEDLAAILLLTFLGGASTLGGIELGRLLGVLWNMLLFFAAVLVVGLYLYPRFVDWIWDRYHSDESLLLASVGVCFALAVLAGQAGYSVALGAFLAGAVVSEARAGPEADRLVRPMRNLFSVLFFVSVGFLFQPGPALENLGTLLLLVAFLIPLRLLLTGVAVYFTGQGGVASLTIAASLIPVGEFSFAIMKQGLDVGAVRPFLFTAVVAIAIADAVATPFLIRASPGWAERVGGSLPANLRGLLSSLTSGVTLLARSTLLHRQTLRAVLRKLLDIGANVLLIAVLWLVVTTSGLYLDRVTPAWADFRALAFIVAAVLILPSVLLILRRIRELFALGADLLGRASPVFQSAPLRRGLVNGLFLITVLLLAVVAFPILSRQLSQYGLLLGAGFLALIGVAALLVWRSVSGLQTRMEKTVKEALLLAGPQEAPKVRSMERVLEEFLQSRTIDLVEVRPDSPAAGRTIGQMNLRSQTGVTIISIERGEGVVRNPALSEALRPGDLLVVLGTAEQRARAQEVLDGKTGR